MKKLYQIISLLVFAFTISNCSLDTAVGPSGGVETKPGLDSSAITTTQDELQVINQWQSGTTRGNSFWQIRRVK